MTTTLSRRITRVFDRIERGGHARDCILLAWERLTDQWQARTEIDRGDIPHAILCDLHDSRLIDRWIDWRHKPDALFYYRRGEGLCVSAHRPPRPEDLPQ